MKNLGRVLLTSLCFALNSHAKPPEDWTWIVELANVPIATADLLADKRFIRVLEKFGPRLKVDLGIYVKHKKKTAAMEATVLEAMTGEKEPLTVLTPQTIAVSGCRLTNCEEKGFIWIDIEQHLVVMALVHFAFKGVKSKGPQVMISAKVVPCAKIPPAAVDAIKAWVQSKNVTPELFRCADR